MRKRLAAPGLAAVFAASALFAGAARADVSIQAYLGGDLAAPDGAVGILVADAARNGFQSLDHESVAGTRLRRGETIGFSDDLILGVLQAGDTGFAGGGRGFAGLIAAIDYRRHLLSEGVPLIFYWFPGHTAPGEMLAAGDAWESFRSDAPSASSGGDMTFSLPPGRGVRTLAYLSTGDGGDVSLSNPGGSGVYLSGNAAGDDTPQGGNDDIEIPDEPGDHSPFDPDAWTAAMAGDYRGLVESAENGSVAGEIWLKLRPNASFTGVLTFEGSRSSFRGVLDGNTGIFPEIVLPRREGDGLVLNLAAGANAEGAYGVAGTLTVGATGPLFEIVAAKTDYDRRRRDFDWGGAYTLAIPAPMGDTTVLPGGNGHGLVTVAPNGALRALLTLGDGTAISEAGFVNEDGTWTLYASLYRGGGFLAGMLDFRVTENISSFDGPVQWKKEAGAPGLYANGFDLALHAIGNAYRRPLPGERMLTQLGDGADNALWKIEATPLDPAPAETSVTWLENNRFETSMPAGESLRVAAVSPTGLVTGLYSRPGQDANGRSIVEKIPFRGVALQSQGLVAGLCYAGGGAGTGPMTIVPAGLPSLTVRDVNATVLASGGSEDFGTIGFEGGAGERLFEVANTGTGSLFLPGLPAVSGDGFSLAAGSAGYLDPGQSTWVRVRFAPGATGPAAGQLLIASNDRAANPFVLDLTGDGVAGNASSGESLGGGGSGVVAPVPVPLPAVTDAPFDAASHPGRYAGVLRSGGSCGTVDLAVTRRSGNGAFTATVRFAGASANLRGTVNADGTLTVTRVSGKLGALYDFAGWRLAEDAATGHRYVTGELTDKANAAARHEFLAGQRVFDRAHPAARAGTYTLALPATDPLGTGLPPGDGIAALSIDANGTVKMLVMLADRERFSLTSALTADETFAFAREWAFGKIAGRAVFPDPAEIATDFHGEAWWARPANPRSKVFPWGFQRALPLAGSAFEIPAGSDELVLDAFEPAGTANAELILDGGAIAPAVPPKALDWGANDRVTPNAAGADERLTIKVNRRTGWITGQYFDTTGAGRRKIVFDAVAFQKQGFAPGNSAANGHPAKAVVQPPAP